MSNSKIFKQLQKRITRLDQSLIPPISKLGNYSERELDQVRGFILLAHAEFESFLEERAKHIVEKAYRNYINNSRMAKVLLSIIAYCDINMGPPSDTLKPQNPKYLTIKDRINVAISNYKKRLENNNGIKEKNVLGILFPIGILIDDIDTAWLIEMDQFGTQRGLVAHKTFSVINVINPSDERAKVHSILQGLSDLDQKMQNLM